MQLGKAYDTGSHFGPAVSAGEHALFQALIRAEANKHAGSAETAETHCQVPGLRAADSAQPAPNTVEITMTASHGSCACPAVKAGGASLLSLNEQNGASKCYGSAGSLWDPASRATAESDLADRRSRRGRLLIRGLLWSQSLAIIPTDGPDRRFKGAIAKVTNLTMSLHVSK